MTFTTEQLIAQARENVKALKMAAVQNAFKDIRPAIELDLRLAEIALSSLEAAAPQPVAVPDGYRLCLIPMEHTEAFHAACTAAFNEFERGTGPCGVFIAGHRAMLSAAPVNLEFTTHLVGEVVAWHHPNHERNVDFRWLDFNVEPGTKLYAIKQERG